LSPQPVHLRVKPKDISKLVVTTGDPARTDHLAGMLKDAKLVNTNRGFTTYTGYYNGNRITVSTHGVGGPSSAIVFEELRMLGAKAIVRLGSTGGMVKGLSVGDFVIPTGAAYTEGSLRMYVPDGVLPAVPDLDLTRRLVENCKSEGAKYMVGLVFSSDAFYSEDVAFLEKWTKRGVISVEMECATLFTLGLLKGFKAASLLVVSDSLVKEAEKELVPAEKLVPYVEKAGRIVFKALTSQNIRSLVSTG